MGILKTRDLSIGWALLRSIHATRPSLASSGALQDGMEQIVSCALFLRILAYVFTI